jgi:hypothetical protein
VPKPEEANKLLFASQGMSNHKRPSDHSRWKFQNQNSGALFATDSVLSFPTVSVAKKAVPATIA